MISAGITFNKRGCFDIGPILEMISLKGLNAKSVGRRIIGVRILGEEI